MPYIVRMLKNDDSTKNARLEFRLSTEEKALIERAAAADGRSTSNWALVTLMKAAKEQLGEK
ncbi:MAG: DUF1778 domain-containing protein [Acidobacteriota bacterium]|nr:DUF1778 domain-containing protein [Acidobacteriota bacterium]